MNCRLLQHIKHGSDYNPGGIRSIYLLPIGDFNYYRFAEDGLFDKCRVERIISKNVFTELGAVNESTFTETFENGIYKQELSTFVRTLSGNTTSILLPAATNKYLVAFGTLQGSMFCFGSDGGASLSFTQISGQTGETSGYQVRLSKQSVYPLFETDSASFNAVMVLGTENGRIVTTEDKENTILTE